MLLHFRNTYKERKIMLLYATICIFFVSIATFLFFWGFCVEIIWYELLAIIFFYGSSKAYLLLLLENNNYKLKYYYSKKKFKEEYRKIIEKYNIQDEHVIKKMKVDAKDYFYQYGIIDIKLAKLDEWIVLDWLKIYSNKDNIVLTTKHKLNCFLCDLFGIIEINQDFKSEIEYLIKIYDKNEIMTLLSLNKFVKKEFIDKCEFLYTSTVFVNEKYLKSMYIEIFYIIKGIIGLINIDEFNNALYNSNYYYVNNKYTAFTIDEKEGKYDVYYVNVMRGDKDLWNNDFENKNDAINFIKEEIKSIENDKR